MSRFLKRLEQINSAAPAPMGFGAARGQRTPGMALVGLVSRDYSAGIAAVADLAPDAALLAGAVDAAAMKQARRSLGEATPWGVRVGSLTDVDAKAYADGGCDLLAFPLQSTTLDAVASDSIARILSLEADIELERLRALDSLPVDAFLLTMTNITAPWTLRDLAAVAAVSRRVSKYILLEVSQPPGAAELVALRDAGVHGLVVDVASAPSGSLAVLKAALLVMPRRRLGRRERAIASLPGSVFPTVEPPTHAEPEPEPEPDEDE
jgi:hypothetical protein